MARINFDVRKKQWRGSDKESTYGIETSVKNLIPDSFKKYDLRKDCVVQTKK